MIIFVFMSALLVIEIHKKDHFHAKIYTHRSQE